MELLQASNRAIVKVASRKPLGAGGEARIFAVKDNPGIAAKIYHRPTPERAAKLQAMLLKPPVDPMAEQGHVSIAWPTDILLDPKTENVVGFLMPYMKGVSPIIDFYHLRTRRQKHPLFNFRYLARAARNLAACIGALHARGYVVGDLNESNILVSETALVSLVDTDSFQVPNATNGEWHRCGVGKAEFTPPELQGVSFAWVDRQPQHDGFGLAVLVFQLLMEGIHPFSGTHLGFGEPPSLGQRIRDGTFPYEPGRVTGILPMPTSPRFDTLNKRVRELFLQTFIKGHLDPASRPSAHEWQLALLAAEQTLQTCAINEQHQYEQDLHSCPWCERVRFFGGLDEFPSQEMVKQRLHLRAPATQRHAHVFSQISYEDAVSIATVAAGRKKIVQRLFLAGSIIVGSGMVAYWVYAIRHWFLPQ
jgi:DNA-binding helix-hairpin-helix protein with protein kinase domain